MPALYNDTDPFVADWLESLIAHGHIPQGTVDRRSIAELTPADVALAAAFIKAALEAME